MTKPSASRVAAASLAAVDALEPRRLWQHFATLSAIPRMSKREGAVIEMLKGLAQSHGLAYTQDAVGNLLVKAPGRGIGIAAPPVLIQGHLDMVTEKNQKTEHNFVTDPIALVRDGEWLRADGTTLGADNGIGVCAALALLDEADPIDLPPLELLFTVDEETGLNGAKALDATALGTTARTLLNLDTEEWGRCYIGCAGGGDAKIALPVRRASAHDAAGSVLEIRVEGLLGGHSGITINEGRANAVQLAARIARAAIDASSAAGVAAQLLALDGGDKHNAIPREASAIIWVPHGVRAVVGEVVDAAAAAFATEYGALETKGLLALRPFEPAAGAADWRLGVAPLDADSEERVLAVLVSLPHGALKLSHAMSGLVETSNNLAAVTSEGPGPDGGGELVRVLCSTRSSVRSGMEGVRASLVAISKTMGKGTIELSPAYPGWQPNPSSRVLELTRSVLASVLLEDGVTEEVQVLAIHAGLECGLIGEKCVAAYLASGSSREGAEVDMVSFGPTIVGAHSPDEAVEIATVPKFYKVVKGVLARLAAVRA